MTVWSATDLGSNISGGGTVTVTSTSTSDTLGRATSSTNGKKVYFEFTVSDTSDYVGFANASAPTNNIISAGTGGSSSFGIRGSDGISFDGGPLADATFSAGDRIGIAFDEINLIAWWKDITTGSAWHPSGDPNLGTGGFTGAGDGNWNATTFHGPYFPAYSFSVTSGISVTGFFASNLLIGAVPTGFQSIDPGVTLMGATVM